MSQELIVTMERTDGVQIVEEPGTKPHHYKRNYFWKMTQHLQKKHKMDPVTAAWVANKVENAAPNPVACFTSKKVQHVSSPPHTMHINLDPLSALSLPRWTPPFLPQAINVHLFLPALPVLRATSASSTRGGFLDGFYNHLKTCAGGNRGEYSASHCVGKISFYVLASYPGPLPADAQILR